MIKPQAGPEQLDDGFIEDDDFSVAADDPWREPAVGEPAVDDDPFLSVEHGFEDDYAPEEPVAVAAMAICKGA